MDAGSSCRARGWLQWIRGQRNDKRRSSPLLIGKRRIGRPSSRKLRLQASPRNRPRRRASRRNSRLRLRPAIRASSAPPGRKPTRARRRRKPECRLTQACSKDEALLSLTLAKINSVAPAPVAGAFFLSAIEGAIGIPVPANHAIHCQAVTSRSKLSVRILSKACSARATVAPSMTR